MLGVLAVAGEAVGASTPTGLDIMMDIFMAMALLALADEIELTRDTFLYLPELMLTTAEEPE
jgi:hypothetical protein